MSVKKFRELFGQSIDEFDHGIFTEVSANRWLALVNKDVTLDFSDLKFSNYIVTSMPKEDERFEVVKKGKLFFDLKVIRTIINNFVSGAIDVAILTHENNHALMIDIGDYYMMLAEKISKRPMTIEKYEIVYNWNDIFSSSTIGDDMVL